MKMKSELWKMLQANERRRVTICYFKSLDVQVASAHHTLTDAIFKFGQETTLG